MKTYHIPSREEHDRFIRRMWMYCGIAAVTVFFLTGGVVLALFLSGHEIQKIVEVSTAIFQVVILSYGLGFFVPCLLTSLFKMALGVEMSREGLEIGQKTAQILNKVDEAIESRLDKADRILERIDRAVAEIDKGEHPTFKKLTDTLKSAEAHMEAIRRRIEKDTSPLPSLKRPTVDDDISIDPSDEEVAAELDR
jgi:hypothetical protein